MSDSTKTWPQRIWLQGCPDDDTPPPFDQVNDGDVTWCADHISSSDVEYIRSDLAASSAKTAEVLVTDADTPEKRCLQGNAGGPEGVVAYRWGAYAGENCHPEGYIVRFATHISTGPKATQEELYSEAYVKNLQAQLAATRAQAVSLPAEPVPFSAENFACYMVDNCEKEVVYEESIIRWLAAAMSNPRYNPTAPDSAPVQTKE